MNKELVFTLDQLSQAVALLINNSASCNVFTFKGPLGAGKTTIVKAFLKELGVSIDVVSPTFSYVNIYTLDTGKKVYHFDLYRLNSLYEFLELGFDEYLHDPESYCLIEWPEIIEPFLKHEHVCSVQLDYYNYGRIMHIHLGC